MAAGDVEKRRQALYVQIKADPEASKRFSDFMNASVDAHFRTIGESISRVGELLALAGDELIRADEGRASACDDAMRAAVVLLHAYMEDYLRTIAQLILPSGHETFLNGLPLAGSELHQTKFLLGELARHRGKLVDDVLRESVAQHLDRETYNNTTDISNLLRVLRFEVAPYVQYFPKLDEMIARRHQIVHRADKVAIGDSPPRLQPIDLVKVDQWIDAMIGFMSTLMTEAVKVLLPIEKIAAKIGFKSTEEQ